MGRSTSSQRSLEGLKQNLSEKSARAARPVSGPRVSDSDLKPNVPYELPESPDPAGDGLPVGGYPAGDEVQSNSPRTEDTAFHGEDDGRAESSEESSPVNTDPLPKRADNRGSGPADSALVELSGHVVPTDNGGVRGTFQVVPLDKIILGRNVRVVDPDSVDVLRMADNMQKHGLIQPVTIAQRGEELILVAGEHRYWAARKIGWSGIGAIVRPYVDEDDIMSVQGSENEVRKGLSLLEQARMFQRYHDLGYTVEQIGDRYSTSGATVSVILKAERQSRMREEMESGRLDITITHLVEFNRLYDSKGVEKWDGAVDEALRYFNRGKKAPTARDLKAWIEARQSQLTAQNKTKVSVRASASFLKKARSTLEKFRAENLSQVTADELRLYKNLLKQELAFLDAIVDEAGAPE